MRSIILLAFICGLLGVPALCAAGAVLHPCECGESIECGHEDDCSDDPCVDVFAPRESGTDLISPALSAEDLPGDRPAGAWTDERLGYAPLVVPLPNLPLPDSALPLLN